MVRSLRFQLPALFLLGVVVAGLVSAAIALRLFRTYAENRASEQAYAEVETEAQGLTQLYASRAGRLREQITPSDLEQATGDRIYYLPRGRLDLFLGQKATFRPLPRGVVNPLR